MNEGDLDFNFNDIQIEVDPTPINLEERTENVSLPDSLLKKVNRCNLFPVMILTRCRYPKKVET